MLQSKVEKPMKKILLSLLFLCINLMILAQTQPQGNRSMYFDGIDDQVRCPAINLNNFTIEFWIKTTQQGGSSAGWHVGFGLIDAEDNVGDNDYGVSLGNGKIVTGIGDGNPTPEDFSLPSNTAVNDGAWHHVAVTRAGNNMQIYIDGNLDNSGSATNVTVPVGNVPLTFGSLQTYLNYFNGQLDEIKIFNVVRTEPEIEADMISSSPDGAVGFWRFEESTGTTIANLGSLGGSHNGILQPGAATPLWALRVTSANDSGLGTLRQVIGDANTLPGINYIDFSIQQANSAIVSTINLLSVLPFITDTAIMDGYSAFGAKPNTVPFGGANDAQIRIQINANSIADIDALTFNTNSSVVKGLSVYGAITGTPSRYGIKINGDGNQVTGCYVGLFANGNSASPANANGIGVSGGSNNIIGGGGSPSNMNIISGAQFIGVSISGTTAIGNLIRENYIGTNITGTIARANVQRGINVSNSAANTQILGNVVSGNGSFGGIVIQAGASNNVIKGNKIGTTANGLSPLGNTGPGIYVRTVTLPTNNSLIGGAGAGEENIIAHNGDYGIKIGDAHQADGHQISSNSIHSNTSGGILLTGSPVGNTGKTPPIITIANSTEVSGTCASCADGDVIEVFENAPGETQGRIYKGSAFVSGNSWSLSGPSFTIGANITATATNSGNNTSSFSSPLIVSAGGGTNFITIGNAVWNDNTNWSSDGVNPCGCNPAGVTGATVVIQNGHSAALNNNADLGANNIINIEGIGSTLIINDNISTPIQELNGQEDTRLVMGVLNFPSNISFNDFAMTSNTTIEFAVAGGGNIPPQFQGNDYRNLVINGSLVLKEASGNMNILGNLTIAGGDSFNTSSFDVTVNGTTTITLGSMLLDNNSGGTNTFNGVINNNGVLGATGSVGNVSTFNFNNDVINNSGSTLNLDCNCQYNFNKSSTPLLLQTGGLMIFGSNGAGSGSILSDLTIEDGQSVTFNVTTAATLLIGAGKTVANNNATGGVSIDGNGALNGSTGSTWLQGANAILYYSSDVPAMATGNFDASSNSNTVIYNRAGDQVIRAGVYNTLQFGGSGLRNVATGNITINSNFTVPSGITFQINGGNFTADGATAIDGAFNDGVPTTGTNTFNNTLDVGGTFQVNDSRFVFRGSITNSGTFQLLGSTNWTFDGAGDLNIQNRSASVMSFSQFISGLGVINGNVTILDFAGGGDVELHSNGGITLNGALTNQLGDAGISRKLTIPRMNGAGSLTNASNAVLNYQDDQLLGVSNVNFTAPDNIFIYSFGNAQVRGTNYYHIKFMGSGTFGLAGSIAVGGGLSIASGTSLDVSASNFNIDIAGDWQSLGVFIPRSGSVIFKGLTSQLIQTNASAPFHNIIIDNLSHVKLNTLVESSSITFSNGRLQLGIHDLVLTASPANNQILQTFDETSASYIETDGIGTLIRNGLTISTNYVFPVGDATAIRHISILSTSSGNLGVRFQNAITPTPLGIDIAAGSWFLSGNSGLISFQNSGSVLASSKIFKLAGGVWDNTGITTTAALPTYSTNDLSFATPTFYTLFTPPNPAIVISPATLDNGTVDVVYTQSTPFTATGGSAPYTFSITSGSLPAGLTLVVDQLVGTPTEAGTFNFMVTTTDAASTIGQKTYTLVITKAPQTVDVSTFMPLPLGENSYELFIMTSSGLPARYRSTNTQIASISGTILTISTNRFAEEAVIQAFQDGDSNYAASDTVVVMKINNFGLTTAIQKDLEKLAKIYPNPTAEKVLVETLSQGLEVKEACLMNNKGEILNTQTIQNNQKQIKVSLETLPSGIYFLKISTNQGILVKKITKY